jgi:hypothetical protein
MGVIDGRHCCRDRIAVSRSVLSRQKAMNMGGGNSGSAKIPGGVMSPGPFVTIKSLLAKQAHKQPSYCIDNQR